MNLRVKKLFNNIKYKRYRVQNCLKLRNYVLKNLSKIINVVVPILRFWKCYKTCTDYQFSRHCFLNLLIYLFAYRNDKNNIIFAVKKIMLT